MLSVLGMWGLARSPGRDLIVIAVPFLVAFHGITLAMSRYRLILLPLLAVTAAAFLADAQRCRRRLTAPGRRVAVVLTLAALIAAWSVHLDKL